MQRIASGSRQGRGSAAGDPPQDLRAILRAPFAPRFIPVCAPISGALGTMRAVCVGVGSGALMLISCWEMREF